MGRSIRAQWPGRRTSDGYTNKEFNDVFNINSIHDVVKKVEFPVDEIHTNPFKLGGARFIPPANKKFFPCNICGGMIMMDNRMSTQWRPCSLCHNIFRFEKKYDPGQSRNAEFKYKFDATVQWDPRNRPGAGL